MQIEILKPSDITTEVQNQVADLYKQLNADNKQRPLTEILQPRNNVLVIICKIDDAIAGIALLSTYKVISGYRGMVDDVVVDTRHRGKGIGRKLMDKVLEEGKNLGLDEILLSTGHHRAPAIGLYISLGFYLKQSGFYSLKLLK